MEVEICNMEFVIGNMKYEMWSLNLGFLSVLNECSCGITHNTLHKCFNAVFPSDYDHIGRVAITRERI